MHALLELAALAHIVRSSCIPANKPHFDWDDTQYLIAFGDSYTFVQGSAGYPNYSFIGSYLPNQFSFTPDTLLTSSIIQNFTATAEGGPNWVEYLTGCGLKNNTRPSTCDIQLWDFAFAGADVAEEFLPLHHNYTVPLVNQTQQYLTYAEPVIGKKMNKGRALVAVWIGINDVNDSVKQLVGVSLKEFWDTLVATVFKETVQPMYDAGYRNFLFVNLPPLDRTSANQKLAAPRPNKEEVGWWNSALEMHRKRFAQAHPKAKTMLYNANAFLNGVMDNPGKYGIKNTTDYCAAYNQLDVLTTPEKYGCLPLDQYFWYNSGHL
ncbi:carbohydrate esterase family 16 protein [Melanomma pulvis-pyrius CBS 109.77]|uniref:Carbohydrate esterase family 16 protein n=1 Tax=Melanomma pulvis-pyrius CBS 109.77 TaxID=1314802 RepID=A0A6A6XJC8_9PLEO|nr:carbohydrate esterase family 16 protein [Melanomma pulvis-pyrius CBS 109.77]